MGGSELVYLTAVELARRIRSKDVSAREVMEAHLAQVERVNPQVNAIVSQIPEEEALKAADAADALAAALCHGHQHRIRDRLGNLASTASLR